MKSLLLCLTLTLISCADKSQDVHYALVTLSQAKTLNCPELQAWNATIPSFPVEAVSMTTPQGIAYNQQLRITQDVRVFLGSALVTDSIVTLSTCSFGVDSFGRVSQVVGN